MPSNLSLHPEVVDLKIPDYLNVLINNTALRLLVKSSKVQLPIASIDLAPIIVPPNLYEGYPKRICCPSLKIKLFGPLSPDVKLLPPILPVFS